jgi:NADH-quinone oxidoreductase subunit N
MFVSGRGERLQDLADYRGLAVRHPMLGGALALFLLSLAGIPLTAGFISKLAVFSAAFQAGEDWLVILGVVASVVGAFFYLRLVILMYMQEREPEGVATRIGDRPRAPVAALAVAIPALATVVFGVFPQLLFGMLQSAAAIRF